MGALMPPQKLTVQKSPCQIGLTGGGGCQGQKHLWWARVNDAEIPKLDF